MNKTCIKALTNFIIDKLGVWSYLIIRARWFNQQICKFSNLADVSQSNGLGAVSTSDDGASVGDGLAPVRPSRAGYRLWNLKMNSLLPLLLTLHRATAASQHPPSSHWDPSAPAAGDVPSSHFCLSSFSSDDCVSRKSKWLSQITDETQEHIWTSWLRPQHQLCLEQEAWRHHPNSRSSKASSAWHSQQTSSSTSIWNKRECSRLTQARAAPSSPGCDVQHHPPGPLSPPAGPVIELPRVERWGPGATPVASRHGGGRLMKTSKDFLPSSDKQEAAATMAGKTWRCHEDADNVIVCSSPDMCYLCGKSWMEENVGHCCTTIRDVWWF